MSKEKDISFVYMVKDGRRCQIDIRGGDQLTKPVYCLDCKLKKPLDQDWPMNLSQALEHMIIHTEAGHTYDSGGYQSLVRNEERYRNFMVSKNRKIMEETPKSRLKQLLDG